MSIGNVSLSHATALQTFYPAPQTSEYDNLPPEPAPIENSLEINKWYKINKQNKKAFGSFVSYCEEKFRN